MDSTQKSIISDSSNHLKINLAVYVELNSVLHKAAHTFDSILSQ